MTGRPWRIGILGAGAMGSLFACALTSRTSHEVWLLARRPSGGEITVEGGPPIRVAVTDRPREPVDLLLVLVKAYATADALRWAAGAIGPETVALTLQNGLGNAEALAAACGGACGDACGGAGGGAGGGGAGRVLAGTTAQGAALLGPGLVRHGGHGPTLIAPWRAGSDQGMQDAAEVATILTEAGIPTEVRPDPQPLLWEKLAVNCGINALTAILRVPNGELPERPGARRVLEAAAREAGRVAAASGAALAGDPAARALAVARATAANRSSMLQDLDRGRRTEIDAINGAVVERGQALGIPTPVNCALADLVRALTPSAPG